jgi:hypothetical protein
MRSLSVQIFLGHNGDLCPIAGDIVKDFTIIDMNGIHCVDVQFCGCYGNAGGSHSRMQLLCARLFPSTHIRPITAFSFNVLDTFHLLTLQGKTNAYDFYLTLAHKSDNTGLLDVNVRTLKGLFALGLLTRCAESLSAVLDSDAHVASPKTPEALRSCSRSARRQCYKTR